MTVAPEEARTEDVLADEHQLMLNRLSFELFERQRYVTLAPADTACAELIYLARTQARPEAQGARP